MVKTTRQQLIEKRNDLQISLNEIEEQLAKFDAEVYGGKMKKAIKLLKECSDDYLNYPTISLQCPECDREIDFDLDVIIDGLQTIYEMEF